MNEDRNPQFEEPNSRPPAVFSTPLTLLAEALAETEDRIDLGFASLAISAAHYPDLDLALQLSMLDSMAAEVNRRLGTDRSPTAVIGALNHYLFADLGFHGNAEDYYNPVNSFLHEVITLRTGLPITLSVLYLSLAHRLDLPLFGVAMPLHFLVKYHSAESEIFIDPFHSGEILTRDACRARLDNIVGESVPFRPAYLEATPKRAILYRLLNNLKQAYLMREEPVRAGRVVEQMLVVAPGSHADVRDRGELYLQENALTKGIAWLTRYLEMAPDAADRDAVRTTIIEAEQMRARLN